MDLKKPCFNLNYNLLPQSLSVFIFTNCNCKGFCKNSSEINLMNLDNSFLIILWILPDQWFCLSTQTNYQLATGQQSAQHCTNARIRPINEWLTTSTRGPLSIITRSHSPAASQSPSPAPAWSNSNSWRILLLEFSNYLTPLDLPPPA